jgi:signal transduction histidine kinase
MKGVKATPVPSLGKMAEWEIDAPSLNDGAVPPSRNPSLHVSIGCFAADNSGSQLLQPQEEEHRQRLAELGEKVGRLAHDIRNPLTSIE